MSDVNVFDKKVVFENDMPNSRILLGGNYKPLAYMHLSWGKETKGKSLTGLSQLRGIRNGEYQENGLFNERILPVETCLDTLRILVGVLIIEHQTDAPASFSNDKIKLVGFKGLTPLGGDRYLYSFLDQGGIEVQFEHVNRRSHIPVRVSFLIPHQIAGCDMGQDILAQRRKVFIFVKTEVAAERRTMREAEVEAVELDEPMGVSQLDPYPPLLQEREHTYHGPSKEIAKPASFRLRRLPQGTSIPAHSNNGLQG